MFIISLKKSVLVTYLGVIFGVLSMFFAFTRISFSEVPYIKFSLFFMILAGICDMFDGKIARMCKRTEEEKEFGIQVDSLADTVNFLILPIVIMLSLGMTSIFNVCVYSLFIICGISRLALFNCNASTNEPVKFYIGLPVTSTAVIYPILGLLNGHISADAFSLVYIIATLITAILFITKIKIPKSKSIGFYAFFIILAIIVTIMYVVIK